MKLGDWRRSCQNIINGFINGYHYGDAGGLTNVNADAIVNGLTTNLDILTPGPKTNTLVFINGILRSVQ